MTTNSDDLSGVRVPSLGFLTGGTGESDDGIPPHPYETFAYDTALVAASIGDFNIVPYTSVLPPNIPIKQVGQVKQYFTHGGVLEVIMAGIGVTSDGTSNTKAIASALGFIRSTKNASGDVFGGYASEYVRLFDQTVTDADVQKDAIEQLTKSLNHELALRNLLADGNFEFHYNFINVEKKHSFCLTCLGFLNFTYTQPVPVS